MTPKATKTFDPCLLPIHLSSTHILVFISWFSFLWNKCPRVGFLSHQANVYSLALEMAQLLSTVAVHLKPPFQRAPTGKVHLKETLAREVGSQGSLVVQGRLANFYAHSALQEAATRLPLKSHWCHRRGAVTTAGHRRSMPVVAGSHLPVALFRALTRVWPRSEEV